MLLRTFVFVTVALTLYSSAQDLEPAERVVRFQVTYPNAKISQIEGVKKWNSLLRNSVLASLRFINKHWLICGGSELEKKSNDCGKAQVNGEIIDATTFRINATFIAERDPIKNAKVQATSTVQAVVQIGLKGGIFQYTNGMKILGKPSLDLSFEEAFFCYRGATLVQGDMCRKDLVARRLRDQIPANSELNKHERALLGDEKLRAVETPIDMRGLAKF